MATLKLFCCLASGSHCRWLALAESSLISSFWLFYILTTPVLIYNKSRTIIIQIEWRYFCEGNCVQRRNINSLLSKLSSLAISPTTMVNTAFLFYYLNFRKKVAYEVLYCGFERTKRWSFWASKCNASL